MSPHDSLAWSRRDRRIEVGDADGVKHGDRGPRPGRDGPLQILKSDHVESWWRPVAVFRDHSRPGGVAVEIVGRLNALLGEGAYPNGVRGVWGKMVAEEGLEPPTRGL